jgi:hypothetical protein
MHQRLFIRVTPSAAPKAAPAPVALAVVFKSVRNLPSDKAATCTYGVLARHVV